MLVRSITALSLFILAVWFIFLENYNFLISLVVILALIATFELYQMLKTAGYKPNLFLIIGGVGSAFLSLYFVNYHPYLVAWPIVILVGLIICLLGHELFRRKLFFLENGVILSIRLIFFFALISYVIFIRQLDNGAVNLFFIGSLVAGSDTFAYLGGKFFGKRKLTSISPKKTVEGAVISFALVVIFGGIWSYIFHLPMIKYVVAAVLVSIFAQMGDLHESLTKRCLNTKDSSHILPGHGGVYDRIDSYFFVFPILYYYLVFI
ncbi:phosphatidate cytidylyltransferase [Candidatus Margulisiibacteriota bacterium]